ncbi:MAG: FHA domain-containing serine/threonine-protein kinase, partial [Planctomycetota bacterium]
MRLTVETGPLAGTTVTLERDHPTVLGSGADCAIRIQEAGVAAQQAVVKALKDQGFGIKALAPGLRLNGAHVEASPLADGDVIELGTTRIAFGQLQKRGLPQIAGYRILEELGRGGMGLVYRAEQTSLHREVALKVLNRELTKDPAFVARFVAEARAAAKLQHPNVVQVFDVDHDGETYFYAMELMHEGSLEDWLKQHGAMPVDRALRVVSDAASGLAYAESLGIVHRDIKPDNLMLDQHGAVKIADLGLASTVEETEDKAIGTPHFMAPEQVLKKELDHRTDLYALGCTFYRLVTGKTPFRGQSVKDILRAQVKDDAEPAHKLNGDVPTEVSVIVQRLMAKDPAARYQTANDLLEDLGVLLQPPAKKGLWIGLAAVGALVAGGAIYWAVTRDPTIVEREVRYDDPEKQQFADEIKKLKKEAVQARATIALLTELAGKRTGQDLADALERVAAAHPDTEAATRARDQATRLRSELADEGKRLAQRRTRIADHLA